MAAAIFLIGGPVLGIIFRSWGLGSMVFGLGAIVLGIRQVRLGEHRSERFIGVGLLLEYIDQGQLGFKSGRGFYEYTD